MTISDNHLWLPYWLRATGLPAPAHDLALVKKTLTALGINRRGWKFYADYGDRLLRPLGPRWLKPHSPQDNLSSSTAYLRLLGGCEVDVAPPRALVAALQDVIPAQAAIDQMPVAVFRCAWRALVLAQYAGTKPVDFVRREFVPVVRWLLACETLAIKEANQARAGWPWLKAFVESQRARRALPPPGANWRGLPNWPVIKGFTFLPLRSLAALEDEGEVMNHCVADLASACSAGDIHVFSIREPASLDRLATLAITSEAGGWKLIDLKAQSNATPSVAVDQAAGRFQAELQLRAACFQRTPGRR